MKKLEGDVARSERYAWLAWLSSALIAGIVGWIWPIPGVVLIWPVLVFRLCWPSTAQMHTRENELKRADFPQLLQLVEGIAREMSHNRPLKVFVCGSGAGAFVARRYDGLFISPVLLAILTRSELAQVLRHELAHLASKEARRDIRWQRLCARLICANRWTLGLLPLLSPVLFVAGKRFARRQRAYETKAAPIREQWADQFSDPACAAAAIVKAEFACNFEDETEDGACATMEQLREAYQEMLAARKPVWLAKLRKASEEELYGSVQSRIEALGVTDFDPFTVESDAEWLREMDAVIHYIPKRKTR